ncbi:MAG: hypothetical protein LBS93_07660 [Synergistaceae bacterium]|jgi:hypothetical protein|nr:hypothetical protein [Synergistaceae bacterium]
MRLRLISRALVAFFILFLSQVAECEEWDVKGDILRLSREAPSLLAFKDVDGIIWLSFHHYSLRSDGAMGKNHRRLIMLSDGEEAPEPIILDRPADPGALFEVLEASWHDPASGEKKGALVPAIPAPDEAGGVRIIIPAEARGCVVALETSVVNPRKYYMDDLLVLAGNLPAWEQRVEVEIPQDIAFYWQGTGVRNPERVNELGVEHIVWTILNQPVWRSSGMLDEHPPTLVFSLRKGLGLHLAELRNLENSFDASPIPKEVFSSGSAGSGNLQRIGDRIASYMRGRVMAEDGSEARLSSWDGTLTAAKWLESLGYGVRVFWSQSMPVNNDGPDARGTWREPVLIVDRGGSQDAFFSAGSDFGKLPPILYGAPVYRYNGSDVQRMLLPRGNAAEHTLTQQWKLAIDENGVATGTLEVTVTGGWMNVLSLSGGITSEDAAREIMRCVSFGVPGLSMEQASVQALGNGLRLSFDVRATLGIVSGGNILMRMPGGTPTSFADVPADGDGFSFSFPFVFEQSAVISIPKGYKAFALPGKTQNGDTKASLEDSIVYWEKSGRIEASSKWTVRSAVIDAPLSVRIGDQIARALRWSETTVPLRK